MPGCTVHHVDPYRLKEGKIACLIDFEKVFGEIAVVEWPERLGPELVTAESPARLEVTFEGFGAQAEGRTVVLTAIGAHWQERLARWSAEGGPLRARPSDPAPEAADGDRGPAQPSPAPPSEPAPEAEGENSRTS